MVYLFVVLVDFVFVGTVWDLDGFTVVDECDGFFVVLWI